MLDPVCLIPRGLLVVINNNAFDARYLLPWLEKSCVDPLTRKTLSPDTRAACVRLVHKYLTREERTSQKGFYKRRRISREKKLKLKINEL